MLLDTLIPHFVAQVTLGLEYKIRGWITLSLNGPQE